MKENLTVLDANGACALIDSAVSHYLAILFELLISGVTLDYLSESNSENYCTDDKSGKNSHRKCWSLIVTRRCLCPF